MLGLRIKQKQTGFTIVELLIVIVVIAILATISIVAYNGIQDRANDTAVKSDLSNLAKKIQLAAAESGEFPAGGGTSSAGNWTVFSGMKFRPAKDAYLTTPTNLMYCEGVQSGRSTFIISAQSKSSTTFIYTPEGGIESVSGSPSAHCSGSVSWMNTGAYGYHPSYGWSGWTSE